MATQSLPELGSLEPNKHGYRDFTLGKFTFSRDGYFAHITWPKGNHMATSASLPRFWRWCWSRRSRCTGCWHSGWSCP